MNNAVYHLIVFLSCLTFLGVIIVTGHDNSPLLHGFGASIFGGVMGGTGAGSLPLLAQFLSGPDNPTATAPVTRQDGFIRFGIMFACVLASLAIAGCATFTRAAKTNPLATACATGGASLKVLAQAQTQHLLTLTQTRAINDATVVIAPVCIASLEPAPTQATLTAINAAVSSLSTLAAPFQAAQ